MAYVATVADVAGGLEKILVNGHWRNMLCDMAMLLRYCVSLHL